ncbi:15776_t:CDS:2 [Dentiscutata erythropus]|uniref:15776_t:CDS:1 n=1 Tax=Dentiscutata erythropus TaxID=1348616 RepID=A0A9N8ZXY2_9GLOM|nr:15776_t:CDS:2 [Dentiscutata erythropus]
MVKPETFIKASNILAYLLFLTVNIIWGLGLKEEESPHSHQSMSTYISPAIFTFYIWAVIHLFLAGFVVYQLFEARVEVLVNGIQWHFVGVTLLSVLCLALWQEDLILVAWIVIIVATWQISVIYWTLKKKYLPQDKYETLFIHIPFSLYHAWILVSTLLTTFASFTPNVKNDRGPTLIVLIFVILGLVLMEVAAIVYIEIFKDIAGASIIAWTLFGIAVEQTDLVIHWTALVLMVACTLHIFKPYIMKMICKDGSNKKFSFFK